MIDLLERPVSIVRQKDLQDPKLAFARDVFTGLAQSPKRLSSVYFYDEEGSILFEKICALEEYYLTRKETEILETSASQIMSSLAPGSHLIELGSGSSTKTRILLEAALEQFGPTRYSPIDISEEILTRTAEELGTQYEHLQVEAVAGFYEFGLDHILRDHQTPKCVMWLGSSIGNFTRDEACLFLKEIRKQLNPEDRVLLGIDLRKSADILEPAYDDAQGITAEFNLNLFKRINRELQGSFQLDAFRHRAVYNEVEGRIEMYLESQIDQTIPIDKLETSITFKKDEAILTEYSYKYSQNEILALAFTAGYKVDQQWLDAENMFSLNLFKPQ